MTAQQTPEISFKTLKLIAVMMMIISPLAYLAMVWVIRSSRAGGGSADPSITYILMTAAILTPLLIPVIQRIFVSGSQKSRANKPSAPAAVSTLFIIKMALVETSYLYGVLVFFITHQTDWLWAFYLIGIAWTIFVWPTRERFEETARQLEAA